jgi:hypothetical protein
MNGVILELSFELLRDKGTEICAICASPMGKSKLSQKHGTNETDV